LSILFRTKVNTRLAGRLSASPPVDCAERIVFTHLSLKFVNILSFDLINLGGYISVQINTLSEGKQHSPITTQIGQYAHLHLRSIGLYDHTVSAVSTGYYTLNDGVRRFCSLSAREVHEPLS